MSTLLGITIPLVVAAGIAYLMWWGIHRRVEYRVVERPYVVALRAKWSAALVMDRKVICRACGWKPDYVWSSDEYFRDKTLPEMVNHRCPTLEEASRPKAWEKLL